MQLSKVELMGILHTDSCESDESGVLNIMSTQYNMAAFTGYRLDVVYFAYLLVRRPYEISVEDHPNS